MTKDKGYVAVGKEDMEAGGSTTVYGTTSSGGGQPAASSKKNACADVLGTEALHKLCQDGRILLACRAVRLFGFGFLAVILATYLTTMGFSESRVGALYTLTLLGDAGISLFMTSRADLLGRRRMLVIGAIIKVLTGVVFAFSTNYVVLVVAGTLGVISPSGNEVGPFQAIEQAALSQVISWYNLFGSLATAFGGLACGSALTYLMALEHLSRFNAYRVIMVAYALIGSINIILFSCLSSTVEPRIVKAKDTPVKQFMGLHESKGLVLRLSVLFALDSFGGSFVLQSLISNWFFVTYSTKDAVLGSIVFICNIVAGISSLFAAALAEKIGLILTMVVTHLPSNVLLILVPLMPTEVLAITMISLRFCISQMDVPTRSSYVVAVVKEDERSAAGGVTNIVRSVGASTGPYLAGLLYERPLPYRNVPFYIAGGLKIIYDLTLLGSFAAVKPPEERAKHEAAQEAAREQAQHRGGGGGDGKNHHSDEAARLTKDKVKK